ncbi:transglutaminase domain-containing protein [Kitasatospora sp. NPDC002551]|uniref:transglutaminase domain-containing protein n=1 Tax=unclassified Kitasatospora TaxID=2633591 RepID=UPI00331F6B3E
MPDRYREFRQDGRQAAREHGIGPALIEELGEAGLPSQVRDGVGYFDRVDLANIALALRLPNARTLAMRGWAKSLRTASGAAAGTFEVEVRAHCPQPGHPGECEYTRSEALRSLDGYTPAAVPTLGQLRHRATATESTGRLPEAVAGLLRPLHFHLLPEPLRADLGFLAETGLADCDLAALYLTREAGRLGLAARYGFGFFLAAPYSIIHAWTEVLDGGEWHAFDPHLLNLLGDWSLLDPEEWPSHRSIGSCTARVSNHHLWLTTHHGACAPLSLATHWAEADAA